MNISLKRNIYVRTSLRDRAASSKESLSKSFINKECQCEEENLILVPSVKVSIRLKGSEEQRPGSSLFYKLPNERSHRPESFINVRSVITKPLLVKKFNYLLKLAQEERSSNISLRKQGKLVKGRTFSKRKLRKE